MRNDSYPLGASLSGRKVSTQLLLRSYASIQARREDFRVRLHDRLVMWVGSERGGVAAEYALLGALIAVVIITGATLLGVAISNRISNAAGKVCSVGSPVC